MDPRVCLLVSTLLGLSFPLAQGQTPTQTISVSADTWVNSASPSTNYGMNPGVQATSRRTALFRFDIEQLGLPDIGSAIVTIPVPGTRPSKCCEFGEFM